MKNCLEYYYDIKIDNVHHVKNKYKFEINEFVFIFFEYENNEEHAIEVYKLSLNLISRGIYCHQIILNRNGKVITSIDNKPYILIKFYKDLEKEITAEFLLRYNTIYLNNDFFNHTDWKYLWENKVDYLEYQINHFGNKHPLLRNSFNYFSGFVETGIQLLNIVDKKDIKTVLCHRRIKETTTLLEFYNPFNFIVDFRIRDFCEYIKSKICQKKNMSKLIELEQLVYSYINQYYFTVSEIQLFFIRLLYPSFYFDIFEDLITSSDDDYSNVVLNDLLSIVPQYENFIIDIYKYCLKNNWLPLIEWFD